MKKLTTKEFTEKAKKVHGDKYDYSLVKYINSRTKINIICPEHGLWLQQANAHLQGQGCLYCGKILQGGKFTTDKFIEKAKAIHGNKYDYSLVEYIDMHTKVKIICPKHGEFKQKPTSHIHQKSGCSKCVGKNKPTEEALESGDESRQMRY